MRADIRSQESRPFENITNAVPRQLILNLRDSQVDLVVHDWFPRCPKCRFREWSREEFPSLRMSLGVSHAEYAIPSLCEVLIPFSLQESRSNAMDLLHIGWR